MITFATPGQGGHNHVNENTMDYWVDRIEKVGFKYNCVKTLFLKEITFLTEDIYSKYYSDLDRDYVERDYGLHIKKTLLCFDSTKII